MAISGVLRPGFAQIRVLDMEEALEHYKKILGLIEVSREADGRVYLKAFDEFDRHSIILRETDTAGLDAMGWKVESETYLDECKMLLEGKGISCKEIPEGDMPGVGRRLRFQIPSGHTFEFYATIALSDNGPMIENPEVWRTPPSGAGAIRFDHCLLYGPDIEKVAELLAELFGFRITECIATADGTGKIAIFLSCSNKAHDLALVVHEEPDKLHHVSFLVEDWNAIGHAADLMTRYDVSVDIGPTRHGITRGKTIYFWDPSGNRNETFAGGYASYPDEPMRVWQEEQTGKAIFYYERELNETFLSIVT